MMGSESCEDAEGGLPARRIPRVCLRRKPGAAAALHVTLSHGSVDLKEIGSVPSSSSPSSPGQGKPGPPRLQPPPPAQPSVVAHAQRQPTPVASFSITNVLPSRHGQVAAAAVPLPSAVAGAAAAAAAAAAQSRKAVVRDSGLSNVFDAFEREFERFQYEVQHNYLSQGCSDSLPDSAAATATSSSSFTASAAAAAATLVLPSPAAGAEPAWCRQCGKCTSAGHGSTPTEHGFLAATNGTAAYAAATSPLPTQHGTVVLSECAACPADSASARSGYTAWTGTAPLLHRPATLHVTNAGSAACTPAAASLTDCTPSSEALSGSVISLFIDEDDQDGYVKRWLNDTMAGNGGSGTAPPDTWSGPPTGPTPPDASGLDCSPKGGLAECAAAVSPTPLLRWPPSSGGNGGSREPAARERMQQQQQQRGMAVFDSSKFRKLKELAESVELELSDFCALPEFELLSPLPARSDCDGSSMAAAAALRGCKYISHHECVRLVPATCRGIGSADGSSGNGSGTSGAASATPTAEQRTPKQPSAAALAEHHERDDADSGYGGSGGSLPPQGGAGARGSGGSKQSAAEIANGSQSSTMPALGREDLCKLIRLYNLHCGSSQLLTMPDGEDTTFQGCIQVCISLSQPISMVLSPRPASIYEALNRAGGGAAAEASSSAAARPLVQPRITTAQVSLPRNAVMSLHVTSEHTAADVVQRLLAKFKITDNPRKFALYEQTLIDGAEVKLRKVADADRPLMSFLLWNSAGRAQQQEAKRFVLKEDNNGDVNWDAFSVPELLNFLRILECEEKGYVDDIRQKYVARRKHLETALKEMRSSGGSNAAASPRSKIRP